MNILAIDDHELFRTGLKHLLKGIENDIDFTSVGSVEEAESLRGQVAPDLILLDYFLNGVQGDEALLKVRQAFPKAVVVVISSLDDSHLIKLAIEHGAAGFIPKSSSQTALINALRLILDGGVYLPRYAIFGEHIVEQKWSSTTEDHGDIDILSKLTVRQKEVVRGVVRGMSNKVIAYEMNISEGTVKSHLSAAFKVLGVSSRTQAVIMVAKEDSIYLLD